MVLFSALETSANTILRRSPEAMFRPMSVCHVVSPADATAMACSRAVVRTAECHAQVVQPAIMAMDAMADMAAVNVLFSPAVRR